MSTEKIDEALYVKLTSDTSATSGRSLTGGRIYNGRGPQDPALPMLTFTVRTTQDGTFTSDAMEPAVRFDTWADASAGAAAARAIDDALFTQLHRQALTVTGFKKASAACVERGAVENELNVLHVRSEYRMWVR